MAFKKGHKINNGRKVSELIKIRMSLSKKGILPKNFNLFFSKRYNSLGKHLTEEHKNRIRLGHKGKTPKNIDSIKGWNKACENHELATRVRKHTNHVYKKEPECSICGSKDKLHFHHWIYKEPVEKKHFSTLCHDCHVIQHGGYKNEV